MSGTLEGEVRPDQYVIAGLPTGKSYDDVYVHDPIADEQGMVNVALVNDQLAGGFGLYWRYRKSELPILNHWQHFEAGTYVTGIEPGNCSVLGRKRNRAAGTLQHITPDEVRRFRLEIGVLEGSEEIEAVERRIP